MPEQTFKVLLDRAEALTGIVRTAWITLILGCLYAWLTLAALRDIDFFLPEKTLTLPIVGTGISVEGFFVFAPALLFSAFLYFQLMLFRLWECYGQLQQESKSTGKTIGGLSVDEHVAPWFLTVLIPHVHHSFDHISKTVAVIFCWGFAPITILAISYRYLRAHDLPLTAYHCVLIAIALVAAVEFRRHCLRAFYGEPPDDLRAIAAFSMVFVWTSLFLTADWLISNNSPFPHYIRILSPHAQLHRAALSRKPPGWDTLRWHEINDLIVHLEKCQETATEKDCLALRVQGTQDAPNMNALLVERRRLQFTVVAAQLGDIPASWSEYAPKKFDPKEGDYCKAKTNLVSNARDLRFAFLLGAYLVNANLHCADLRYADLREAVLEGADLRNAEMRGAVLKWAQMQKADLTEAQMQDATLWQANLQGAVLNSAQMQRANLNYTKMRDANLSYAHMQEVTLWQANLQGAVLSYTHAQAATLWQTNLQGAVLWGTEFDQSTDFTDANFSGALLRYTDLSETNVSAAQLERAFGDGSVKLPQKILRPSHWPDKPIEGAARFYNYWQGWRVACGWQAEAPGPALVSIKEDFAPIEWDRVKHGDPHCPPESPLGETAKAEP